MRDRLERAGPAGRGGMTCTGVVFLRQEADTFSGANPAAARTPGASRLRCARIS